MFQEAEKALMWSMQDSSVDIKFRSLGALAHLYYKSNKKEALIDLTENIIIPNMQTYTSHLAQRVCGQALGMIGEYSRSADFLINAFDLESNDVWSLKTAILMSVNAQEIEQALDLYELLERVSPDSDHYLEVKAKLTGIGLVKEV